MPSANAVRRSPWSVAPQQVDAVAASDSRPSATARRCSRRSARRRRTLGTLSVLLGDPARERVDERVERGRHRLGLGVDTREESSRRASASATRRLRRRWSRRRERRRPEQDRGRSSCTAAVRHVPVGSHAVSDRVDLAIAIPQSEFGRLGGRRRRRPSVSYSRMRPPASGHDRKLDLVQRSGGIRFRVAARGRQDPGMHGDEVRAAEGAPTGSDLERDITGGELARRIVGRERQVFERERRPLPLRRSVALERRIRATREVAMDGGAVGHEGDRDRRRTPVLGEWDRRAVRSSTSPSTTSASISSAIGSPTSCRLRRRQVLGRDTACRRCTAGSAAR